MNASEPAPNCKACGNSEAMVKHPNGQWYCHRTHPLTSPEVQDSAPCRNGRCDHEEVRCELMADVDCETKAVGEPRTCCVCAGHDCHEARAERQKQASAPERKP